MHLLRMDYHSHIHYIILKSISNDDAGKYRNSNILLSGSSHKPVEHFLVEDKMRELIEWYNNKKLVMLPIELAATFHFRFVYIHPFIDGNGRTARLLMNLILMRNGYPLAIIRNEDRSKYMMALEKASTTNEINDFIEIVLSAVDRSLDTYLYMTQ